MKKGTLIMVNKSLKVDNVLRLCRAGSRAAADVHKPRSLRACAAASHALLSALLAASHTPFVSVRPAAARPAGLARIRRRRSRAHAAWAPSQRSTGPGASVTPAHCHEHCVLRCPPTQAVQRGGPRRLGVGQLPGCTTAAVCAVSCASDRRRWVWRQHGVACARTSGSGCAHAHSCPSPRPAFLPRAQAVTKRGKVQFEKTETCAPGIAHTRLIIAYAEHI